MVASVAVASALAWASAAAARVPPPLYYAGDSFAGLPMTERYDHPNGRSVDFIYGTCDPFPHGCAEPLSVQNWRLRHRHPRMIFGRCDRVTIRGAPAAFFEFSGGLDVYIGWRSVVVFADSRALMLRAARALRRVAAEAPPRRLPRPPRSVYRALEKCSGSAPALTGRAA